jgi:hypothetical protein
MKKRLLAVFTALILCLSCGVSVSGATAATIVVTPLIDFDLPVAEALPDTDIVTDYTYYTVSVNWGAYGALPFVPGETRSALFTLTSKSKDFIFAPDTAPTDLSGFIPGQTPSILLNSGDMLLLQYSFTTNSTNTVTIVPIARFDAPVPLNTPENITTIETRYEGYNITGLTWSPAAATFAFGETYTATFTLTAAAGYTFPSIIGSGNFLSSFYPSAVCVSNSGGSLVAEITFDKLAEKPVVETQIVLGLLNFNDGDIVKKGDYLYASPSITDSRNFKNYLPIAVTVSKDGAEPKPVKIEGDGKMIGFDTSIPGEYLYRFSYPGGEDETAIYLPAPDLTLQYTVNAKPVGRKNYEIDTTWAATDFIVLTANDLATDSDGELTITGLKETDETRKIVSGSVTESGLILIVTNVGSATVTVQISDGTETIDVPIKINVYEDYKVLHKLTVVGNRTRVYTHPTDKEVTLTREPAPEGKRWDRWTLEKATLVSGKLTDDTIVIKMPRGNATATMNYIDDSGIINPPIFITDPDEQRVYTAVQVTPDIDGITVAEGSAPVTLTPEITDEFGDPVYSALEVMVNKVPQATTGVLTIDTVPGTYEVIFKYSGDEFFAGSTATVTVTVTPNPTVSTPYVPPAPPVPIVAVTPITPKPTKDDTVEAGVNPSGSLNSDSTAAAVKAAAKNGEEKVIVNANEELKGISETAINKLLAAAPKVTIAQNFTDENIRITIPLKAGMGSIYTGITPVPTGTGIAAFETKQKTDFGTNVRYALDLDIDASTFADCEDFNGGKIIYVYINGTTRVSGIYKNGKIIFETSKAGMMIIDIR